MRSLKAKAEEVAANPRARSARLRVAVRTQAPVFPEALDLMPKRAPLAGVCAWLLWLNISFSVALIIMIGALYHIRYSAEGEARAVKKMERAIAAEEDVQRTLRAEWSSLNDPRRLQDLARHYLEIGLFAPVASHGFASRYDAHHCHYPKPRGGRQ